MPEVLEAPATTPEPAPAAAVDVTQLSDGDLTALADGAAPTVTEPAQGEATKDGQPGSATAPAAEAAAPAGGAKAEPVPTISVEEFNRLRQNFENSQRFIQRQAAEIGMYRKQEAVPDFVAKRKEIAEKFQLGDPEALTEWDNLRAQEQQYQQERQRTETEQEHAQQLLIAYGRLPELPQMQKEIRDILVNEDGLDAAVADQLTANLAFLGQGATIYSYGKRVEAARKIKTLTEENQSLKTQLGEAKARADRFIQGVEQATSRPQGLRNGSGIAPAAGSGEPRLTKPVHLLTDAELKELNQQLATAATA